MELSYWQSRWQKGNTGWHMDTVYPLLPKVWPSVSVPANATILIPLSGKSLDMPWFVEKGFSVIGVDTSPLAHRAVMKRSTESFKQCSSHGFTVYRSENIELWEGDFFKLPVTKIPPPDLIYDKAAIIALPPEMRSDYAQKLFSLCGTHTQILLQTFDYIQNEMNGPPFSVPEQEIERLFGKRFSLNLLHKQSKLNELDRFRERGISSRLDELVYLLTQLSGK